MRIIPLDETHIRPGYRSWKRAVAVALIALALGACAPPPLVWNKTGMSQDEFARDRYQCVKESATSWSGGGMGTMGLIMMAAAKGEADRQAARLYRLCMEAHGYQASAAPAPAPPAP